MSSVKPRRRLVAQAGRATGSEGASAETAMISGEAQRHGGERKFRAVGPGGMCQDCEASL